MNNPVSGFNLQAMEDRMIDEALRAAGGFKSKAARMLGVSDSRLLAKLERKGTVQFWTDFKKAQTADGKKAAKVTATEKSAKAWPPSVCVEGAVRDTQLKTKAFIRALEDAASKPPCQLSPPIMSREPYKIKLKVGATRICPVGHHEFTVRGKSPARFCPEHREEGKERIRRLLRLEKSGYDTSRLEENERELLSLDAETLGAEAAEKRRWLLRKARRG